MKPLRVKSELRFKLFRIFKSSNRRSCSSFNLDRVSVISLRIIRASVDVANRRLPLKFLRISSRSKRLARCRPLKSKRSRITRPSIQKIKTLNAHLPKKVAKPIQNQTSSCKISTSFQIFSIIEIVKSV